MHTITRQRGTILVTSLLILLVLTVLGVTAMQMTRMQEHMAGNSRDLALAFQASEAALRDGERRLKAYVVEPLKCTDPADACTTFYERGTGLDAVNAAKAWWDGKAQEYGEANKRDLTEGAKDDPRFATEELAHVRNCLVMDADCGRRTIYQVTARSTGGSGQANTVLQSTYAKPPY
jgi:type IV pilus assembly protein PilX